MDPVTWIEAAFVSVTVSVTVCPELMLFELAWMATVGTPANAVAADTEIATKVKNDARKGKCFTGPALVALAFARLRSGGRGVPAGLAAIPTGYEYWTDTRLLDALSMWKEGYLEGRIMVTIRDRNAA